MSIQVKICGITSADAADAAMRAGADFVGLNFHPHSPRSLKPEQATSLAVRMRGRCRLVALLADAGDEEIAVAVAAAKPDFIQLHGRENPGRIASVRLRFGLPVIKAMALADAGDLAEVAAFEKVADMLVMARRSIGNCSVDGLFRGPGFLPAASRRKMSPVRSARPKRRVSMCRQAWRRRPESRAQT
jgi:phosphoribosylanthranilate isomerase